MHVCTRAPTGANYAYEQINVELQAFVASSFSLAPEQVEVAVIGLRIDSEHEDSCCVTIELTGAAQTKEAEVLANFLKNAKKGVSKGAKPDYVRAHARAREHARARTHARLHVRAWLHV
jgi:hypothetical protein